MTFEPTTDGQAGVARRGLAPVRVVLDNGVVILARQTRKTPAVTINLTLKAGTISDPPAGSGATNLLARVIDRGSAHHSGLQIAEELDGRGISLAASVRRHMFTLMCTCLAEDAAIVLELLGDILMAPSIPENELAVRKREVLTAIRQDEDNPSVRSVEALMQVLYGPEHPYKRPVKGPADAVERLSRDDLLALHCRTFTPPSLIAVIVGDVPETAAVDLVHRVFGAWRGDSFSDPVLPACPARSTRQRVVIQMMNKAQADIAYGFTTISRGDPSYYSYVLMNNVLGQSALGGRLGDSIRERQGMAYYVFSSFDPDVAAGPLMIRAGVSSANVERTVKSIDEELDRFRTGGVTSNELAESRQFLIGSLPRVLETNAGIAGFLQTAEFYGLGEDYDVQLQHGLEQVTLDGVNAAASHVLHPNRASVVIAGPYQDEPSR